MIYPGAGGPELDKMASEKVKKDIGTFITFGLLVEAGKAVFRRPTYPKLILSAAFAAHYFGIDGILV
ncbi:hypothetical protein CAEBREN_18465 [Caenorhabditis brenneri]|uniref:Uncharacterized protein n=1 Tax=Caenorhabditis brenneri TaxID=135651 RepID=G0NBP1_CAEBE|nr:hypothetical protein CAEBREN_18465 [Caenorhabditis brenneri]